MTVGAPACGMNSCIRAFVRLCLFAGHKMKAIHDSFVGLVAGRVSTLFVYQYKTGNAIVFNSRLKILTGCQ